MADVKSITIGNETYNIKDATARSNYTSLNSTVTQQGTKITEIEDDVQTNTQDITTLTTTIGQHTSQITAINGDISEINVKLESVSTPVYSKEDIKFGGGN